MMREVNEIAETRMREKGQVTLPRSIREAARLESGDHLVVEYKEGTIVMRPQKMIDASQAWFWTPEWQTGERRASEDITAGRVELYKSDEDFLASLDD